MKRIVSIVLCVLFVFAPAACGDATDSANSGKINVVATIFAPYDFAREIAGDKANITMLLPPGSESHSFEPSPLDIIRIQNCDAFIHVGGESDEWVKNVLSTMETSKMKVVTLMDCVEVVEEVIVEGMQEEGHEHAEESFTAEDVKDRNLSDWEGDWQSVYPHLMDGTLAPVMKHKAEAGNKTAEEYFKQYKAGYETNVDRIVIEGDFITFYTGSKPAKARYVYCGPAINKEEDGSLWVRYKFEAAEAIDGAPKYILFSDHLHVPKKSEHFHIYSGNENFDVFIADANPVNYPTYYPSALTKDELVAEMLGHDHGHDEAEYDEHVWTSPRNAKLIVQKISDTLCEIDPANADAYSKNSAAYIASLDELDVKFQNVVNKAARKTIVFGDRFPFRYLADAYGLKYFAAFPGCSTETEASAKTVAFLIDKVKEEKIPVVFHIELSNKKMAETISEETGAKVLLLHACHNITRDDLTSGVSYLKLMTQNVEALREALK